MKQHDIIAYIEGDLKGAELEAFEFELQQNPDFVKEVELYQQLAADIEIQTIRETVTTALKDEDKPPRRRFPPSWILGIGIILLLVIAGYSIFEIKPTTEPAPALELPVENPSALPESEVPVKEEIPSGAPKKEEKKTKASQPIAENQPSAELPSPLFPPPNIRGSNQDNEAWKAVLNQIWYTEYPPSAIQFEAPFDKVDQLLKDRAFSKAYVRLQLLERKMPENDSLFYLKGYCLLEMGEGTEALRYFDYLADKQADWNAHLQWYRGLSNLLSGKQEQAMSTFKTISSESGHPFQLHAKKAVQVLE